MTRASEAGPQALPATAAARIKIRMLKRKIFGGLVEHGGVRHVTVRIDRRATQPDFVVQVRSRDPARAAYQSYYFTAPHFLPDVNVDAGKVRVIGLDTAAVVDPHQAAITASHRFGLDYDAIRRTQHGRTGLGADVHAFVKFAFTREGVDPLRETAHEPALDRPKTRLHFHRQETARYA